MSKRYSFYILFAFTFIYSLAVGQDSTKHFQKNVISLDGVLAYSIGKNMNNTTYSFENGKLISKNNLYTYGARLNYVRHFSEKYGLGIELSIANTYLQLGNAHNYWYQDSSVNNVYTTSRIYEKLTLKTQSIIVKNEWQKTNKKGNLRFVYQLGAGVTFTQIADKDYHAGETVSFDTPNPFKPDEYTVVLVDDGYDQRPFIETTNFKSISLLNSFGLDIRLNRSLYLNFTVRQTLNYLLGFEYGMYYIEGYQNEYQFRDQTIKNQVGNAQFYSGLVTSVGLKYAF